jgi:DNA-binding transcriptional ArsR family regulator
MAAVASHDELITASNRVQAALSAPIEILFALYFVGKFGQRHPDARFVLDEKDPALAQQARDFWVDSGDFTELIVFAHRSGTLFDESAEPFLRALPAAAAETFEIPDFPGEDPRDAATIRNHILELRTDAGRRADYVDVVRHAWAVLEPEARANIAEGRKAVADLDTRLARLHWRDALPNWSMAWCTQSEPYLDPAAEAGELVVAPMYINQRGKFIFSMPGMTVLSFVPREKPGDSRIVRDVAETIAARHKLVSDPTRLQLLGTLVRKSATVSELADLYGLSQPTISVHMKQLRESGLVLTEREGAQVLYRTDSARLRELLGDDAHSLTPH